MTASGRVVSQVRTTLANGVMQYHLMTDSQGSIISEGAYGNTTQDMSFDAWGKTRNPDDGSDYGLPPEGGWAWHNERLYTGHESHQDQYVINMNGRLYDPVLSRMMSADPFVPSSGNNPQGLNRYAYVFNNPLRYTDPDGFAPFWKKKAFRIVAAVVASIVVPQASQAWFTTALGGSATAGAVAAGAAGGFTAGLIASGGNLEAAFAGAATGAAFAGAGALEGYEVYAGHAAAGCLSGVVQGGGCGRGAASAVVGKMVTLGVGGSLTDYGKVGELATATIAGGISSRVAGGEFAAGATTAAFGYLYNGLQDLRDGQVAHRLLQDHYDIQGYASERSCVVSGFCVNGRFDIADPRSSPYDLWEIKKDNFRQRRVGERQLERYTNGTGFVRGGDLPGLTVNGAAMAFGAGDRTYTYSNVGRGLITYQVVGPPSPIERFLNQLGRAMVNNPPIPMPGAAPRRESIPY